MINLRFLFMVAVLASTAPSLLWSADPKVLNIDPVTHWSRVTGKISGYETERYKLTLTKGQYLTLSLDQQKHKGLLVADFIVSLEGKPVLSNHGWKHELIVEAGDYLIEVTMPRSFARRKYEAAYQLNALIENGPGENRSQLIAPEFEVLLSVDVAAQKVLKQKNEGVRVFAIYEGTKHAFTGNYEIKLGAEGGLAAFPMVDFSSQALPGEQLNSVTVSAVASSHELVCGLVVKSESKSRATLRCFLSL